jgi:hypothetical protein
LQAVDRRRVGDKKQRADLAATYAFFRLDRIGDQPEEKLRHLADLLFDGHLRKQGVSALRHVGFSHWCGLSFSRCGFALRLRTKPRKRQQRDETTIRDGAAQQPLRPSSRTSFE